VLDFAGWLQVTPVSVWIQSVTWVIPLLQSIHILVIGVVFTAILMIALRVLGRMRMDEPFAVVWNRFSPWLWRGLVVMVLTGVLLAIGEPIRQVTALSFWLKMTLLATAVVSAAAFGRRLKRAADGAGAGATAEFTSGTKLAAAATVVLWLTIIFLGRAIAYDVEVWGSLHLGS
jgi:hypothetical protein